MEIQCIGFHHPHNGDFVIDRPNGSLDYLLLFIKTPAMFNINGREIYSQKNSFILFTPNTPQFYKAVGESYIDDWMHFRLNDNDKQLLTSLEIPTNKVVHLGSISDLSDIMKKVTEEFYSDNSYKDDITECYLRILFMRLSGFLKQKKESKADAELEKYKTLRNAIYNMPHINRTVDDMAKELSVSRSGFQHSYKKHFGVGVTEDKIAARLSRAEFYLSSTAKTLGEISELCGYKDEVFFLKQFKKKKG